MITLLCGGKKTPSAYVSLIEDYRVRTRAPFNFSLTFQDEAKLARLLEKPDWPFPNNAFVIVADERGRELTSPAFSETLSNAFIHGKEVVILIGGAYGFPEEVRARADLVWSFSPLVFPHLLARLIVSEQIYRAQEISRGSKYHHI